MSPLLSPNSPELDDAHFSLLAHYAKYLGRAPKARRFRANSGERRSRQKGHGMEMLELRLYQSSDELRHIDWRVTARTGQAHTRIYAQENEHQRLLLLDLSSNAYFGTRHTFISTRFLQLAGLIAWRSEQQGDKLSYRLTYGTEDQSSNKQGALPTLLHQLKEASKTSHRKTESTSSSIWSNTIMTTKSHNKDVIIMTDKQTWNKEEEFVLMRLAKHNQIHWIQIIDSNTFNLPAGQYQFADRQGSKLVNVSKHTVEQAKVEFFAQNTKMRQKLASLGIRHQMFDLTESPEKIARYLLAQGALR